MSPGVTKDTVRLGLILTDTGTTAKLFIGARAGIDARIRSQNERGGVRGRTLVYDWRDDESNPAQNLAVARELVENGKVFGLLSATSVATGSAQYLHGARVPVAGLAMESVWSTFDNMVSYMNQMPSAVAFDTLGRFSSAMGVQRAVIVMTGSSETSRAGATWIAKILQYSGIGIAATLDYSPAAITPALLGRQIAQLRADGLFVSMPGDDFSDIYYGAMTAGAAFKVGLGVHGYGHELLARNGTKIGGAYFYVPYLPFEANAPAQRAYLDAVTRYAPELNPPEAQAAVESYITTDLLIRGLEAVGPCPTRDGLLGALRSISDFDGSGLLPVPIDLTQGFGQPGRCLTFVRVNQAGAGFDVMKPPVCGELIPSPTP
ncbi:ABC transporter substrate-binding protein [Parafrankia sp. EAN1pec]|uniref:ABC transporter substrate-binding protein n=1 Tax=Parafrankia sp. (strain EAN1pec) TaxID=298653 RepID=UPI003219B4CC